MLLVLYNNIILRQHYWSAMAKRRERTLERIIKYYNNKYNITHHRQRDFNASIYIIRKTR